MAHHSDPAGLKLRLAAAQRLKAVLGGEHFSPLGASELPDGRDRGLANRLITTALRRHGQIDFMMRDLLDKGMPGKSGTFEAVLRLSLAQLWLQQGKTAQARQLLRELSASGASPFIRKRAGELLP